MKVNLNSCLSVTQNHFAEQNSTPPIEKFWVSRRPEDKSKDANLEWSLPVYFLWFCDFSHRVLEKCFWEWSGKISNSIRSALFTILIPFDSSDFENAELKKRTKIHWPLEKPEESGYAKIQCLPCWVLFLEIGLVISDSSTQFYLFKTHFGFSSQFQTG